MDSINHKFGRSNPVFDQTPLLNQNYQNPSKPWFLTLPIGDLGSSRIPHRIKIDPNQFHQGLSKVRSNSIGVSSSKLKETKSKASRERLTKCSPSFLALFLARKPLLPCSKWIGYSPLHSTVKKKKSFCLFFLLLFIFF